MASKKPEKKRSQRRPRLDEYCVWCVILVTGDELGRFSFTRRQIRELFPSATVHGDTVRLPG